MKVTALHIAGVLLVALCYLGARTVLKDDPDAGHILVLAGGWLYGKIAFEPSEAVLQKILQRLAPAELERLTNKPPPPAAPSPPTDAIH